MFRARLVLVSIALVTLAIGCHGRGTDDASTFAVMDPSTPDDFATVRDKVLMPRCATCHSDIGDEQALIQKGWIIPGDYQDSKLYQMIESGQMPRGGVKLAPGEIDLVRRYITAMNESGGPRPTPTPSASPSPSPGPSPTPSPAPTPVLPTYSSLSVALIQTSCMPCHASPAKPPGKPPLDSYDDLVKSASDVLNEMSTQDMPPDGPAVSPDLINAFQEWIQQGYPK